MENKNNILEIKNICKNFKEKRVLDHINLNIRQGEICGLIGLNGMGKTTLIKVILNLIDQDLGDCFIYGEKNTTPKSRENLFYLPEKFQPSLNLTVQEFFNIFIDKKNITTQLLKDFCNKLDLNQQFLTKKIGTLSKGTVQKIGLIASMIEDKKLIILDEPMSGLDPLARINLKNALLEYKNKGNSIFFSSHILVDLDEICDNIAILHNTKIIYYGTPKNLKSKYNETSLERAFIKEIGGE